jgi:hypothetical protein
MESIDTICVIIILKFRMAVLYIFCRGVEIKLNDVG